jgi:hypothetical protein
VPSASVAAETLQESNHQRRVEPSHVPKDAPNIVIILLDDVGSSRPYCQTKMSFLSKATNRKAFWRVALYVRFGSKQGALSNIGVFGQRTAK